MLSSGPTIDCEPVVTSGLGGNIPALVTTGYLPLLFRNALRMVRSTQNAIPGRGPGPTHVLLKQLVSAHWGITGLNGCVRSDKNQRRKRSTSKITCGMRF